MSLSTSNQYRNGYKRFIMPGVRGGGFIGDHDRRSTGNAHAPVHIFLRERRIWQACLRLYSGNQSATADEATLFFTATLIAFSHPF
jgi:hypothetical protein